MARRRRGQPPRFPDPAERALLRLQTRRLAGLRAVLDPRVEASPTAGTVRAVRQVWEASFPPEPGPLLGVARQIDSWATTQTVRSAERLVAVDVKALRGLAGRQPLDHLYQTWARENAQLITTVEARYLDRVAEEVLRAVQEGATDLAAVLRRRFGVAKSDAARIARTETAKLNSQITQARQQALGITRYQWSTSEDERVREEHVALNGTIRRWDDPHPTEGHPGEAINCRCTAAPVLDDEDAAQLEAEHQRRQVFA